MSRDDINDDVEEAFFTLRDDFVSDVTMLNSIMGTGTPFYVYPFAGAEADTFLTLILLFRLP